MTSNNIHASGPLRDHDGTAKYRHEAIAVVLRTKTAKTPGLHVLATQRTRDPYAGQWALPSGSMEVNETLKESIERHLKEKLDIPPLPYLEQIETRSAPTRDPYDRTVATSYLGLVPWTFDNPLPKGAAWLPIEEAQDMAFDHSTLVTQAVERLRKNLTHTNIGFAFAPKEFTIAELRSAYTAVLGHDISATNLQRILQRRHQLIKTDKKSQPGAEGGRPAHLYRFTTRELINDRFE